MPKPRVSTIAARVTLKERRLLEKAAKKQDRTLSEWMRLTLVIEAEIQLNRRVFWRLGADLNPYQGPGDGLDSSKSIRIETTPE